MRTICTLAVVFSIAGIPTAAWSGPPHRDAGKEADRDTQGAKWRRLGADAGTVRYREGYREDARDVATYLDAARSRLSWPFPELLAGAPADIRVTVQLEPQPSETMPPGWARTRSRGEGDGLRARIRMLTPSAHPELARTKADLPMDASYIEKTLLHEYAGLVLDRFYRVHNEERDVYDEPDWFVQGWQEYLAIRYGPQRARDEVLPAYLEATSAEGLFDDDDVAPADPYAGGAVLLAFLHHNYGAQPVHCIARTETSTFAEAFESCFGFALDTLPTRYDPKRVGIAPMCRAATPDAEE